MVETAGQKVFSYFLAPQFFGVFEWRQEKPAGLAPWPQETGRWNETILGQFLVGVLAVVNSADVCTLKWVRDADRA